MIDELTDKHLDILRRVRKRPVWSTSRLANTHPAGITVGVLRSLARRGFLAEQRTADAVGYTITALGRAQVEQRKLPKPLTRVRQLPTDEELEREGFK